jgi:dipeptidase E
MYLSSFEIGNSPEALQELAGSDRRAATVMNALDNFPDQRARWLEAQRDALVRLGFSVSELDLRAHFGPENDLRGFFSGINTIWVNGGNAFILRRAMMQSGFDAFIRDALARDTHVYAGFSAAAVICHRSMAGLELTDDPNDTQQVTTKRSSGRGSICSPMPLRCTTNRITRNRVRPIARLPSTGPTEFPTAPPVTGRLWS